MTIPRTRPMSVWTVTIPLRPCFLPSKGNVLKEGEPQVTEAHRFASRHEPAMDPPHDVTKDQGVLDHDQNWEA